MDTNTKYTVYLDGIEISDQPRGLDELIQSISREDGFDSTEQIFRDVTETQMEFWGDGAKYLSDKRRENLCEEILLSVEVTCDGTSELFFEGLIKQTKVDFQPRRCIARVTNIKDNSFSGLIRDIINVEIPLYNTKTKNCLELDLPVTIINTPTVPNTYSITDITAFDALDILKYIVAYFTDNRITVKSTYLTTVKIAIATGYSMHNDVVKLDKSYPKLSIERLFKELRTKETLYMGVKYEIDGTPYLSVEAEADFYSETELLMVIDKLPLDAEEKLDDKAMYNSIEVGSSITKVQTGSEIIVDQNRLTSWNKETYIGCGGCGGEKDTTLNIVSDFIIDANLIHEAMNEAIASDYEHDDAIFMLNYYYTGYNNKLVGNNLSNYNERWNNENVLKRWVGLANSCIIANRFAKYGFKVVNTGPTNDDKDFILFYLLEACTASLPIVAYLGCRIELYDNQNAVTTTTQPTSNCTEYGPQTAFECQEDGIYEFHAKSNIEPYVDSLVTDDLVSADFEVRMVVFDDNTLTTIIDFSPTIELNMPDNTTTLEFDFTKSFGLVAGNVVMVEVRIVAYAVAVGGRSYYFNFSNTVFEMLTDNTSCEDITDSTGIFKPFITSFEYDLCLQDFLSMRNKKEGYLLVENQKAWIKKVQFKHRKKSVIYLKHKETFSGC